MDTPKKKPVCWAYEIRRNDNWGKFVIDSSGYFSCVTDFGSYAFQWTAHGTGDFREFLSQVEGSYLMSKLHQGNKVCDLEATVKNLKATVLAARRATSKGLRYGEPDVSREDARDAWEGLEAASNMSECDNVVSDYPDAFYLGGTDDYVYDYPQDLRLFAKILWPQFTLALAEDLKTSTRVFK